MAASIKKSNYDVIITGAGLSGLIVAKHLSQMGKKVLVLEARDTAGGNLRNLSTKGFSFRTTLEFVPDYKEYIEPIERLEQLLQFKILGPSKEMTPKTFKSSELREFLGFGDLKFQSLDEVQWYTQTKVRELLISPEKWVEALLADASFECLTLHEVTRYSFTDGRFDSITVNGSKVLSADQFIHTAPVSLLNALIPDDAIKPKDRTRLAKTQGWTSVCLHFLHKGIVTDEECLHILMGSSTDFEPCLGRFFTPTQFDGETVQESQWMSLMNDEHAEDMEFIGATLRNIKKQIKRVYDSAVENVLIEKIVVTPQSQGFMDLKFKNPLQLNGVENFWLASPLILEQRGVGASVQAADQVLTAMMAHSSLTETTYPAETPVPVNPELTL
ncbi:MAG: FAD-dependent oxidoreductase [Bdellovibrionales bacterium]|nr:FAD-dependent oxidoreductase [Bdellovibrionales bacterium]